MSEFDQKILIALSSNINHPMTTVYGVCARLGERQGRSTNKFYVRVYRSMERLVKMDKAWVMRGTRDPSVYLSKSVVKGYDENGIYDLPF